MTKQTKENNSTLDYATLRIWESPTEEIREKKVQARKKTKKEHTNMTGSTNILVGVKSYEIVIFLSCSSTTFLVFKIRTFLPPLK
jgi:hypothetical protein